MLSESIQWNHWSKLLPSGFMHSAQCRWPWVHNLTNTRGLQTDWQSCHLLSFFTGEISNINPCFQGVTYGVTLSQNHPQHHKKQLFLQKLFHLPASQPKLLYKNYPYLGKFLSFPLFLKEEFSLLLSKHNPCTFSVDPTHFEFLKNLVPPIILPLSCIKTSPSECALSP